MTALATEIVALRLLTGIRPNRPLTLDEHVRRHGKLELGRRTWLRHELEASGLQGRGGSGFPIATKLGAVASHSGKPIVLVNGAEGEPLSDKDKFLLRHVPQLVLDGAVALAADLGAKEVLLAVGHAARAERAALAAAVRERRALNLDARTTVEIAAVPDGFVVGEETALVSYLNGGPAKPTGVPPRPFERGIDGRPTLVQNVETVAHVALIARHGASWFRTAGTLAEPGSALFTLSGAVNRPGVYEADLGIPLEELVAQAGGLSQSPRAVLVGGYFGSWVPAEQATAITMEDACLRPRGGGVGARAIYVLPESVCGVAESARITGYLAAESAGQCGPCVNGLASIAHAFERCARGQDERARIERWCRMVTGRGACRHPDGAARFAASAIKVFEADFHAHASGRCTRAR